MIHIFKTTAGRLLLAAAVGGVLGILFAPDKGDKTRKKLSQKGEDLTDDLRKKFNAFLDEAKREVASVKRKADDVIDKVRV